ncbi:MAG: hypothetical protein K8R63_05460 [Bacteroidales bacterium]|nr:hypothetical protein [Bacteroidales bacterium]
MLVFDFSSDSVFGMGVGPFDRVYTELDEVLRTGCWVDYGLWIMNQ